MVKDETEEEERERKDTRREEKEGEEERKKGIKNRQMNIQRREKDEWWEKKKKRRKNTRRRKRSEEGERMTKETERGETTENAMEKATEERFLCSFYAFILQFTFPTAVSRQAVGGGR